MSPADRPAAATDATLTEEFRDAIADARDRVAAVLTPACPTTAFLAALREEVERAITEPEAVPYPELSDPDAYWDATVTPQAREAREAVAVIVEWLEERIVAAMGGVEADFKQLVDAAIADPGDDPAVRRAALADEIEARCRSLHDVMGEIRTLVPAATCVAESREAAAEAIRSRAVADVESLREAYLRDAGGDEAHQRFAAEQWTATFEERVVHRHTMLAAEAPWRHQEYALVGFERTHAESGRIVETAAVRLQAPLSGMARLVMERYDEAVRSSV